MSDSKYHFKMIGISMKCMFIFEYLFVSHSPEYEENMTRYKHLGKMT